MASFYGWGSTASRLQPLRGGSLYEYSYYFSINRCSILDTWISVDIIFILNQICRAQKQNVKLPNYRLLRMSKSIF